MAKNDESGEKSRFSKHMTNPFRRAQNTGQVQDPTQQPYPGEKKHDFQPPSLPPPGYNQSSKSSNPLDVQTGHPQNHPEPPSSTGPFQPPPGPPPSHGQSSSSSEQFQPPPGPPPSQQQQQQQQPPDYAPWMSIPDTSQLPPPPSILYETSPTANATARSADEARAWVDHHPLSHPRHLLANEKSRIAQGDINFPNPPPPTFSGRLSRTTPGTWTATTRPSCPDTILIADLPLYSTLEDNPRITAHPKTIYFEILVKRMGGTSPSPFPSTQGYEEAEAGIAIGFLAPPYPSWRLPGWERASLGIHGDDGRKYIHNNLGGQDFTTSFKEGEVVGVGMTFGPSNGAVDVFFTREGEKEGGWNLFEERDGDVGGSVEGLEGGRDLYAAVGMFGGVEFETRFRRDQWLYRPRG